MRKVVTFLTSFVFLSVGALVFSQNTAPRLLERIREMPRISTQEFQQNRAEIQRLIQQRQIEFRNQIREKRQEMKAQIEALREQFRDRLKARIDERKQTIVERIYERINALNEIITNHYLDILDRLEKILERIESRTTKAELNGIDVTQVEAVIEKAHQAINTAREAVKTQAEKIYQPPEITSEENLRLDVGKLRQQLHDDLKAVEKLVKEARNAVREAAVALAQIPKVDALEVPNTQPTQ